MIKSKRQENSSRFELGKFGAPSCKEALKPKYCTGGYRKGYKKGQSDWLDEDWSKNY